MIQITGLAKDKIEKYMEKRGGAEGIRIGVKTTGCNGLSYVLEYVDNPEDIDSMFEHNGIKIFVNPKNCRSVGATLARTAHDVLAK